LRKQKNDHILDVHSVLKDILSQPRIIYHDYIRIRMLPIYYAHGSPFIQI